MEHKMVLQAGLQLSEVPPQSFIGFAVHVRTVAARSAKGH